MKRKLLLVIALLALPLSGCSIISVGYNYADAILKYSINSYASFNNAQKQTINTDVKAFMGWHRKKMLPEYISFLQELQRTEESGAVLKKEDVARFRTGLRTLYVRTLLPAIKPAAKLLSGMSPGQVQEMAQSFARENSKQRDKELGGSIDDRLRKRAERSIDFLENQVGVFSDRQLEKIREMSRQLPFATAIYISQREDYQARLVALLKNNSNEEEITAFLSSWLLAPEANRSADEQSMIFAFENASDEMIANVYQMLTERQKNTLHKNILKYIDTFQELVNKQ